VDPFFLVTLPLMLLIAVKLRALKAFDDLMAAMHRLDEARWVALGRPIGYFWRPEDQAAKTVQGVRARRPILRQWLFSDPDWLAGDSPLRLPLATWRITTLLSWAGFGILAVLAALAGAFWMGGAAP
jgi:hypothetical protein